MIGKHNTLICIFSYNMGAALERCIISTLEMCKGFDISIIDDQSDDDFTLKVIDKYKGNLNFLFNSSGEKSGKRHGNLYENIQFMCDFASDRGYDYIFLLQDDMQFVRELDEIIISQYSRLFGSDPQTLQVDPRFLRKGYDYEVVEALDAYRFHAGDPRRSYADVGILKLSILKEIGWKFLDSEAENKKSLAALGYQRVFPFSPVVMHVPFPVAYRNGKRRASKFLFFRGHYHFHSMTPDEKERMDRRPLGDIPYFRKYLRPKAMLFARLLYAIVTDASALR